jgi:transcription termination factor Rho
MSINITHLRSLPIEEIVQQARSVGIDNAGNMRTCELVFELTKSLAGSGNPIQGDGILEILSDGFGFLRSPVSEYAPGTDDIYVSPSQIRRFNLRTGDHIEGRARAPREGERYLALLQIHKVNGGAPDKERDRYLFETLDAELPSRPLQFDSSEVGSLFSQTMHACLGQRLLLRAPGRYRVVDLAIDLSRKSSLEWVHLSLEANPDDLRRIRTGCNSELFVSHYGDSCSRHIQIADLALLRAKRLVEKKNDVILFVDSFNALARAGRDVAEQQERTGSESRGAAFVRSLWGASRTFRSGGSLTVIGVLRDPVSTAGTRLCEELLAGAENEVVLCSELIHKNVYPPIAIPPGLVSVNAAAETAQG